MSMGRSAKSGRRTKKTSTGERRARCGAEQRAVLQAADKVRYLRGQLCKVKSEPAKRWTLKLRSDVEKVCVEEEGAVARELDPPTPDEREASLYFLGRKREYDEAREALRQQLGLGEVDARIAAVDEAASAMRNIVKKVQYRREQLCKTMREQLRLVEVDASITAADEAVGAAWERLKEAKKLVKKLKDEKIKLLWNLDREMSKAFLHRTYQEECAEEIAAKLKRFM